MRCHFASLFRSSVSTTLVVLMSVLGLLSPHDALSSPVQPSADGDFLTAWHVQSARSARAGSRLLRAGEPGGTGWSTVVSSTAEVDAGRERRPRRRQQTWFGLVLVADRSMDVELKLGSDGNLAVFLDGDPVSTHEKRHTLLWDDHLVRLRLEAGRHSLLLRTTRPERYRQTTWRIVARVHDPDTSTPPAGLHYELPGLRDLPTRHAEASTLEIERQFRPTGWQARVQLPVTGSAPPDLQTPWVLTRVGSSAVLAQGQLGGEPVAVALEPPREGSVRYQVRAGERTWTQRYFFKSAWHEGLLSAARDFSLTDRGSQNRATLDSIEYNLHKLEELALENIPDRRWLGRQIQRLANWARAMRSGVDPYGPLRGDFYRAYRSPYDDRLQPYSVHIPRRYNGQEKWPLVIGLHGIGSGTHYTLRRVLGRDRDREGGEPGGKPLIRGNMPRLPDLGVLTATAWGYHNSAFWFYGEDDVLRVIDEMKAAYSVDPDRVYLTGLSLGGLGTYHIGHHFPDVFAALGPLGGFSSIKLYRQIRRHPKTSWEEVLIEQRDATTYAENGRHNPMRVVHGRRDAPRHARAMTDRYDALGYPYELEIPELGHDVWQYSYGDGALIRWMKRYRRPRAPDDIVFKTHSYRYVRAYWARVGWIDDYTRPALLKVHVDRLNRSRIVVTSAENLRGFSLDLSRPELSAGPVQVQFDVSGTTLTVSDRGTVHFRRIGQDAWQIAAHSDPPQGHKRRGMSGPLDDIMFEPHTFVVGTQDSAQTDVNRRLVVEDRNYLRHMNHDIWFPAVDDDDVTPAMLQEDHLVLYGNPDSNAVLRKALATGQLPIAFEDDGIRVGDQVYRGDDVGLKMIFPSPFNPERMLVIVAGVTWRGTLLSRFLPRHVPDIIVYDQRIATRYAERILVDRPVHYGAFFESDWTLPAPNRP